jgi:hypothetical protein
VASQADGITREMALDEVLAVRKAGVREIVADEANRSDFEAVGQIHVPGIPDHVATHAPSPQELVLRLLKGDLHRARED